MKIHLGLILLFISSSLFASSKAEGGRQQMEETEEKRGKIVEVETLNVQLRILSLLEQIKDQNNEVIKDISNGLTEVSKRVKEIKIDIKDITDGIAENKAITEIKENTKDIKQDINGLKKIFNRVSSSTENLEKIRDYSIPAMNCNDLRQKGDEKSGIRTVHPYLYYLGKNITVLCDQETEGGGWTVFQQRENLTERENFQRNWKNYTHGFGNLDGEFWMGLELINVMSKLEVMELRVDLEDDTGEKRFAKYETFSVENEEEKFKLNIGAYSGTAGDSLTYHNKQKFSTADRDNDDWPWTKYCLNCGNCAVSLKGAWWYKGCHESNLNGFPHVGNYSSNHDEGMIWLHFRGYWNSMVKTKMMFRPSV